MLSEEKIIGYLHSEFPKYIGDDAAFIKDGGDQGYVMSKDLLVEDVHFRLSCFDPLSLAHKALNVNLSDIAAMGGTPRFALLGISIPISCEAYAHQFLEGFVHLCKNVPITLIGGDTTKSPDKLFISVTIIGTAEKVAYRKTAQPGDLICVAGNLGCAHVGFLACEKSLSGFEEFKMAFLKPTAKVEEGLWLRDNVTAMMDLSDGLFVDLGKLCAASKVQAQLNNLQPTQGFKSICESLRLNPVEIMLVGGEDYGLLFTMSPSNYQAFSGPFFQKFGYEIQPLGFMTSGNGMILGKNDAQLPLKPFSHFKESL